MILQKDNLRLGLVVGVIAPLFGMVIYYFWKFFPTFSIGDFLHVLVVQKTLITALISFSLLANAVVFTLYINTRRDRTAKGIFIITCIYAVAAFVLKMFLR
ncbi:hypothetical protein FC093_21285 [Ilyomonas limi]|uniref:Stationary phase survival protein SurE n=1 Tax=Ilyomonas limi TaxID=2575867 RepID=A0A4U3KRN1_9BACT|nr:hypothetical protein [Ilyomonas limi]TKK64912.1 hypothetical protein FC093_21285 [Ilyomonas limi]